MDEVQKSGNVEYNKPFLEPFIVISFKEDLDRQHNKNYSDSWKLKYSREHPLSQLCHR
jgi:hypothetical protein